MRKSHRSGSPALFFNSRMRLGSLYTEQYRTIRSNLDILQKSTPFKSLLITSPGSGEGKSTVAMNLAVLMAKQSYRVLLIDADVVHSGIHESFSLDNHEGLIDVLEKNRTLVSLVKETSINHLSVLTRGQADPDTADWIKMERLSEMMQEASDHFDRVIVDSASVLSNSSTPLFANVCDGTIMVAKTKVTTKESIHAASEKLVHANANFFGVILNDYPMKKRHLA